MTDPLRDTKYAAHDRLLTPDEAAAKLATTRGKVVALARGGAVPA